MKIRLAISPCPNDTFIFEPIINGRIDLEGLQFSVGFHDVETLNGLALQGQPDMVKVSYHAWLYLQDHYTLLDSGSALGQGNGPLLIAKNAFDLEQLCNKVVAVPGAYTTAHLLLRLLAPPPKEKRFMVFSAIEDALLSGKVDAGVIIHENRFTYMQKGLVCIADLGSLWESRTGSMIPLGGILARKELGTEIVAKLNRILYRSVSYSLDHPEMAMPFVQSHAQEMDLQVMRQHIQLYVNEFTLTLGAKGHEALQQLRRLAAERGII